MISHSMIHVPANNYRLVRQYNVRDTIRSWEFNGNINLLMIRCLLFNDLAAGIFFK